MARNHTQTHQSAIPSIDVTSRHLCLWTLCCLVLATCLPLPWPMARHSDDMAIMTAISSLLGVVGADVRMRHSSHRLTSTWALLLCWALLLKLAPCWAVSIYPIHRHIYPSQSLVGTLNQRMHNHICLHATTVAEMPLVLILAEDSLPVLPVM